MKHLRLFMALSLALLLVNSAAWLPTGLTAAGLPDGPVQVAKLVAADRGTEQRLGQLGVR